MMILASIGTFEIAIALIVVAVAFIGYGFYENWKNREPKTTLKVKKAEEGCPIDCPSRDADDRDAAIRCLQRAVDLKNVKMTDAANIILSEFFSEGKADESK